MSTDRHLLYILLHNIIFSHTVDIKKYVFTEISDLCIEDSNKDPYYTTYNGIHIPNLKIYLNSYDRVDEFLLNMVDNVHQINFKLDSE